MNDMKYSKEDFSEKVLPTIPQDDSSDFPESSTLFSPVLTKLQQFVTLNNWRKSIDAQLYKITIEYFIIRKLKHQSHFRAIRSILFQYNQLVPVLIIPDRAKHKCLISIFFESK